MIKLENINKYYFKGERHQIHVVNNVTLEFPKAGFVTLLGASGSGKTTLLNIIGGLDKFDSGTIYYGDKSFDKYQMDEVDKLRNEKIGYIFQNYLLINHFTVYDNLRVALEAIDVLDPAEQNKRIEYALKCVGLYKYRKKKVKNLSGGQMQRVSIARCIVKNSEVIIADEPTGNIDSENTIQIMNILKKISETKLVILVTHEISIARYYSDRIIQIKDGQILSDGLVTNNGTLNTQTDRKIYLGDLKNENTSSNKLNFELYVDESSTESDLIIAVRNDTIYIKSSKKIVNLDESSIELVDGSYKEPEKMLEEFDFDTSWYKEPKKETKRHFFKTNLLNGFKELLNQGKSKVGLIILNIILGVLIGVCFVNLGKFTHIVYTDVTKDVVGQVVTTPISYLNTLAPENEKEVYLDAYDEGYVNNVIPFNYGNYYFSFKENFIFSTYEYLDIWSFPYQDDFVLITGNRPYGKEIVIGKALADVLINNLGYNKKDYNSLLGYKPYDYTISGVVDKDTMSFYYNPIALYYPGHLNSRNDSIMIDNLNYYLDTYTLINGTNPVSKDEIIIDNVFASSETLSINDTLKVGSKNYKIVGIFEEKNIVDVPSILALDSSLYGYTFNSSNNSISKTKHSYELTYLPDNEYEIVKGRDVVKKGECIVHVGSNLEIGESIYGYKIVGMYNKSYNSGSLGNNFMFDNIVIISIYNYTNRNYSLAYEFNDGAEEYFNDLNYKLYDLDDYQRFAIKRAHQNNNITTIVFSIIFLGVSVLLTFLINRSRIINEIHTIGVYRSIGKSRKCLIYQKIGYNLFMTSVSTIIGYSISWGIRGISNSVTENYTNIVPINLLIVILGVIVLYSIGIFIGLLPTISLIKKTPAEINSKYDI